MAGELLPLLIVEIERGESCFAWPVRECNRIYPESTKKFIPRIISNEEV
jgi:hypothetical protein